MSISATFGERGKTKILIGPEKDQKVSNRFVDHALSSNRWDNNGKFQFLRLFFEEEQTILLNLLLQV